MPLEGLRVQIREVHLPIPSLWTISSVSLETQKRLLSVKGQSWIFSPCVGVGDDTEKSKEERKSCIRIPLCYVTTLSTKKTLRNKESIPDGGRGLSEWPKGLQCWDFVQAWPVGLIWLLFVPMGQ